MKKLKLKEMQSWMSTIDRSIKQVYSMAKSSQTYPTVIIVEK